MLLLQGSRKGGSLTNVRPTNARSIREQKKGVITSVGPRNADGKDSIRWDSGNMASSKY